VKGERSGLLTRIATTENGSLCADEKLTSFSGTGSGDSARCSSLSESNKSYGRGGAGVRRGLGVGVRLGAIVAVGVGGHVATGVGPYLPPVFKAVLLLPPQTIISLPVHTAV
jgi:hypothetical protein